MTSSPRGRRALKFLALLLVIPVLGAGGVFFWIHRAADRKWAEARRRIQELTQTFPVALPPQPTSEASKELQIHFVATIREAVRRTSREEEAKRLVGLRQSGETVDAVLGDAQEFLDRLHEGARRCAATPTDFPPGWRGEWDDTTLRFIMNCCVLRARQLREKQAPLEAAETLLDSLQLARFWAASGKGDNRVDALHALTQPLDELRDILARETLSRDRLRSIEGELEPLEAALRSPTSYLEPALARWAEGLEAWDFDGTQLLSEAPYRWRYLLPKHLMKAEAFEFLDRQVRRLLADEGKSYLEMAGHVKQLYRQMEESKNPILRSAPPVVRQLEWVGLERMAEFRLLRVAARYRASGEILKLKDPYGGDLLHSRNGNRMKFWSRDSDGMDDGGDAGSEGRWTWHIPVPGAPTPRPPKDLVIEVEHPRPQ
jgi:hypothetical protein